MMDQDYSDDSSGLRGGLRGLNPSLINQKKTPNQIAFDVLNQVPSIRYSGPRKLRYLLKTFNYIRGHQADFQRFENGLNETDSIDVLWN